jgi:hypothetical protein
MAFGVGFLLAFKFILTWMSLDSAMALAIPASVKHYLLGTWSTSCVTCQELAFYSIFVAGKQAYLPTCAFLHGPRISLTSLASLQVVSYQSSGRMSCR